MSASYLLQWTFLSFTIGATAGAFIAVFSNSFKQIIN